MKKKLESEELDPECTFQPKLLQNKKYYYQNQNPLQFHERLQLWKAQKELKIQESRKKDEDKDIKDCTFQPTTVS